MATAMKPFKLSLLLTLRALTFDPHNDNGRNEDVREVLSTGSIGPKRWCPRVAMPFC